MSDNPKEDDSNKFINFLINNEDFRPIELRDRLQNVADSGEIESIISKYVSSIRPNELANLISKSHPNSPELDKLPKFYNPNDIGALLKRKQVSKSFVTDAMTAITGGMEINENFTPTNDVTEK